MTAQKYLKVCTQQHPPAMIHRLTEHEMAHDTKPWGLYSPLLESGRCQGCGTLMLCGWRSRSERETSLTRFCVEFFHTKKWTAAIVDFIRFGVHNGIKPTKRYDEPFLMTAHKTKKKCTQQHPVAMIPRLTEHEKAPNLRGSIRHCSESACCRG